MNNHVEKRGGPTFLVKLYEMIENEETTPLIDWLEDGHGFQITDLDKFCDLILP